MDVHLKGRILEMIIKTQPYNSYYENDILFELYNINNQNYKITYDVNDPNFPKIEKIK